MCTILQMTHEFALKLVRQTNVSTGIVEETDFPSILVQELFMDMQTGINVKAFLGTQHIVILVEME